MRTSGLNITQRVGGSLGEALLTVILQGQLAAAPGTPAGAFGDTFWWAVALLAVAVIPAAVLAVVRWWRGVARWTRLPFPLPRGVRDLC